MKQSCLHLESCLTLQPSRYKELTCYVDILLWQKNIEKIRKVLEDFCILNPNMLVAHTAYFDFLVKYDSEDDNARCLAAVRVLALDPSNDVVLEELVKYHNEDYIQAKDFLQLVANHLESLESDLINNKDANQEDHNYVDQVWTLLEDVCATALVEEEDEEDEEEGVEEEEEEEEEDSSESSDSDSDQVVSKNKKKKKKKKQKQKQKQKQKKMKLSLQQMLILSRPSNHRPCWFRNTVPNASIIATLPLSWIVHYRMHEGMSMHRIEKTTAIHRGTSYVECLVTDPTSGETFDLQESSSKAETYVEQCAGRDGMGLDTITMNVGLSIVPLSERTWWKKRYENKLMGLDSVNKMLNRNNQDEEMDFDNRFRL